MNILLNKVNYNDFHLFIKKYAKKEIPNKSTLRKSYVDDINAETMNKIRYNITKQMRHTLRYTHI